MALGSGIRYTTALLCQNSKWVRLLRQAGHIESAAALGLKVEGSEMGAAATIIQGRPSGRAIYHFWDVVQDTVKVHVAFCRRFRDMCKEHIMACDMIPSHSTTGKKRQD